MTIISDKPEGLPSSNALDDIPDDILGPAPATIRMSGKDMLVMDKPPEIGECVKMEITMRCKDDGRTLLADGGIAHYRVMSFVTAKVTAEPYMPAPESDPPPDDDDPAMIDRDGNIPDDETGEIEPDVDALNEFDPEFSHNGTPD
ncbi:hypothetical protein VIMS_02485 [Mycobacterium marinum]|uniref:hypothetical protein n=1 Tax=Mycobacterium marinum TaxID=1781 RepID=UPI000E3D2902|nr:hypothetical protein [Mycobacterium marinum]RFZ15055.1 hypothetical protein VIMS_02485 [Mycobacterium marinum]